MIFISNAGELILCGPEWCTIS